MAVVNGERLRSAMMPKVLAQLIGDVLNKDLDKIEELFRTVPIEYLIDFLEWEDYTRVIEKYEDSYNLREEE